MKRTSWRFARFFNLTILVALLACTFSSCEKPEIIVNGLTEREANEIIVFLSSKDIAASKTKSELGGTKETLWDIQVPSSKMVRSMAILNMAGLPRKRGQTLLKLFAGGGLVSSESQEKIRYRAGLAEQLAGTIRKIDGILDVDIQLSFPPEGGIGENDKEGKVTASVYVKHQGVLDDPNAHLTTKIKRLVASGINELEFENVTVIADRARFSDVSIVSAAADMASNDSNQKDFVKVWSVVIDKEYVGRFRTIFFSFSIVTLTLFLTLAWLAWKTLPLIQQSGGLRVLLSIAPISSDGTAAVEKKTEKTKDDKKEKTENTEGEEGEEGEEEEEDSADEAENDDDEEEE